MGQKEGETLYGGKRDARLYAHVIKNNNFWSMTNYKRETKSIFAYMEFNIVKDSRKLTDA